MITSVAKCLTRSRASHPIRTGTGRTYKDVCPARMQTESLIELHQLANRLKPVVRIQLRDAPISRTSDSGAPGVCPRAAKQLNAAVRTAIRFHAFKYLRAVMEVPSRPGDSVSGPEQEQRFARAVPAVLLVIIHNEHMIRKVIAKAQACSTGGITPRFSHFVTEIFMIWSSFRFPSNAPCCGGCPRSIHGTSPFPPRPAAAPPPAPRPFAPITHGTPANSPLSPYSPESYRTGGHDRLFIVQDDARHPRRSGRNAVFGAEFSAEL